MTHSNKGNNNLVQSLLLLKLLYCWKSHKTNYKDNTGTKEKYSNKNKVNYIKEYILRNNNNSINIFKSAETIIKRSVTEQHNVTRQIISSNYDTLYKIKQYTNNNIKINCSHNSTKI